MCKASHLTSLQPTIFEEVFDILFELAVRICIIENNWFSLYTIHRDLSKIWKKWICRL